MSRALLYPIPNWPAPSVACAMLSSVQPGQSLSRDRCPRHKFQRLVAPAGSCGRALSQYVVDETDTETFAKEVKILSVGPDTAGHARAKLE